MIPADERKMLYTNAFDRFIVDELSVQNYFTRDEPSLMVEAG
jgi:hypothetical protein